MAETIEVEATPIDVDLTKLSKAEEWLAQANKRAKLLAEQYKPHPIVGAQDYKDSKQARADARKDIAAIEAERKSMTDQIERQVRDFKDGAKKALEPLAAIDDGYATEIHAYEEQLRSNRRAELEQEYGDFAPGLVPLVPFDLILQRYGNEANKKWLNMSTNEVAAKQMLYDAVEAIGKGEQSITSLVPEEDQEEVKAFYFRTLDLNMALAEANKLKEQRERVRQLEAERAMYEAQAMVEPDPQPVVETSAPPQVEYPVTAPWVIAVPSATREQMQMVADFMRANGIVFSAIYSGTVADAYRKETGNA